MQKNPKSIFKESQKQVEEKVRSLEIYYQTNEKNIQIKELKKEKSLYNTIILLSTLGVILVFYSLISRQKAIKQKLSLEKEEKARLEAEQRLLFVQKEHLQRKALATSLQLDQKNTFIDEIAEIVKEKKDLDFQKILKEEYKTDKDFELIQNIIQEVHPTFFKLLHSASKNKLSNQDLRYAAYIHLNMDNYQIANLLKVNLGTVRKTKYRLKQKIGLEKDQDLQAFIQNLTI